MEMLFLKSLVNFGFKIDAAPFGLSKHELSVCVVLQALYISLRGLIYFEYICYEYSLKEHSQSLQIL